MNSLNLDGLHAVRDRKPTPKQEWRPPVLTDLARCAVLAFDQSLSATAAVLVSRDDEALHVRMVRQYVGEAPEEFSGNERHLRRAVSLSWQLKLLFEESLDCDWEHGHHFDIVHEAPPVGGGVQHTTESTLLAALALRIAANSIGAPVQTMVTAQQHKKAICGDAMAKKVEEHRALRELATTLPITGFDKVTNADRRDALCVAITHLMRMK